MFSDVNNDVDHYDLCLFHFVFTEDTGAPGGPQQNTVSIVFI